MVVVGANNLILFFYIPFIESMVFQIHIMEPSAPEQNSSNLTSDKLFYIFPHIWNDTAKSRHQLYGQRGGFKPAPIQTQITAAFIQFDTTICYVLHRC